MGESNGSWGLLTEHDPELATVWDEYQRLPNEGSNDVLDAFVSSKRLDIAALVRVGARLSDYRTLAFAGPGYCAYRKHGDRRALDCAGLAVRSTADGAATDR